MQVVRGKTITDIEIGVTANKQKRTFTIRKYYPNGKPYVKYRTIPLSKEEFETEMNNTSDDWDVFLRRTNVYYKV